MDRQEEGKMKRKRQIASVVRKRGRPVKIPEIVKEEVREMDDKTLDDFPVAQEIKLEGSGNGFEFTGNTLGFAEIGFPMA